MSHETILIIIAAGILIGVALVLFITLFGGSKLNACNPSGFREKDLELHRMAYRYIRSADKKLKSEMQLEIQRLHVIINKLRADLNESAEDAEAINFDDDMEDVKELANATQRLKDHKIHVVTCAKAYTSAIGVPYHPPFIK